MIAWLALLLSGAHAHAELPRCVVPLTPSLAELTADLLGSDWNRICGVTEYADRPAALAQLPRVGRYDRFSIETVVALKPDLILAALEGNSKDQVERLRSLGLRVIVTSTPTLDAIADTTRQVARELGLAERGERQARAFSAALDGFRKRNQRMEQRPTVLLQLGEDPLIVASQGSFLNDALSAVGARNAVNEVSPAYPRISKELVVARQPDWILVLALGRDRRPFQKMATAWTQLKALKAVRAKQVRVLVADSLLRPNASVLEGLFLLEKSLKKGGV